MKTLAKLHSNNISPIANIKTRKKKKDQKCLDAIQTITWGKSKMLRVWRLQFRLQRKY